jgi:pimeloyl-ACP methyl ester carboxylesterase
LVGFFERSTVVTSPQHEMDVDGLTVAYVDEGRGPARAAAARLADVVVPLPAHHAGPGPAPPRRRPRPARLRRVEQAGRSHLLLRAVRAVLDALVERLGLDDLGLVVHDLGGPIGVHWALHRPGRISRLALLNTLLYPDFDPTVVEFVMTLADEDRRHELVSEDGLREVLRVGVSDPDALPGEALDGITAPFTSDEDRQALAQAGFGLHPDGFADIARLLPGLQIPVLGLYGTDDRILPDVAQTFAHIQRDVPHAQIQAVPGAGHFLQEEVSPLIAERLTEFFKR